jgi:Zn-dependent protease with chaperone function
MDFFEAQARAKKRTTRLVVLFALAVLGIILAGYVAALVFQSQLGGRVRRSSGFVEPQSAFLRVEPWQPGLLLAVTASTLAVVGLASLYKWNEFSGGGSAVAESVGARRVQPNTTDLRERQLLNVTEEMAIAAGLPAPAVYVLDDEPGINAFAAGLTTSDAAVCVTRGTLDKLTRDELQGVIGHEFSHILNGDMRLNLRLTAIIFGILVIGLAGRGVLWALSRGRIRGGKKGGGAILAVGAAGVALLVLGYVGYFFGRLIQAAVSRQRELLADAAAVQFTRNPGGIAGALKKIGGYALGSSVIGRRTEQLNHFFFAQGFRSHFGGAWATHPPLDERIRAIDPQFDGKMFDPPQVVDVERENFLEAGFAPTLPRRFAAAPAPKRLPLRPVEIVAEIGTLTAAHFRAAQERIAALPAPLLAAAHDPVQAPPLIYALLLADDETVRARQLALIAQHDGEIAAALTAGLRPSGAELPAIPAEAKLPLLQLALPALRFLEPGSLDRFLTTLDELIHADGTVTPFEFALQKIAARQLRLARRPAAASGDILSFAAVADEISAVLSSLARAGGRDEAAAATAFATGAGQIPTLADRLRLLPLAQSGLAALDRALDQLALASPVIKRRLLIAAAQTVSADGTVTPAEGELFRALCAALDVPMPAIAGAE